MNGRRDRLRGRRAEALSAACREGSLAAAAVGGGIPPRGAARDAKEPEGGLGEGSSPGGEENAWGA